MSNKKDILNNQGLKQNPFTTPSGYFQKLNSEVSEKICKKDTTTPFMLNGMRYRSKVLIAASIAALFMISYGSLSILNESTKEETERLIKETNRLADEGYLPRTFADFSEVELDDNSSNPSTEAISSEQIVEYLKTNNVTIISLSNSID
ncbi:MAG: hypothetical protein QMB39_06220 [Bacteroidales bacterium]